MLLTPEMTILRLIHSVLGNSENELLGQPLLSMVHSEDSPAVGEAFSSLLNGRGETQVVECRVRGAEGPWNWFEIRMTDMPDDPHVQAIMLNCHPLAKPQEPV